ncbi:NADH-dependent FMN reductase [Gulosibacter molinativorax]|uniref:NADH-dependent FMN reductase n=2 Tax=Gulosibacter molinativorax TaxID=256821 RepID=A0ABT7C3E6_9MICO|nr:NADH-dependent FMN reductase [Gulosibacter molinativorax]
MLAEKTRDCLAQTALEEGAELRVSVIELRDLRPEIGNGLVSGLTSPELEKANETIAKADGVIAATPVFKAEASALFSGFFQLLDRDALIGTPVILEATAGTARHALVVDGSMRSQFAYLRALVVPTSLFAASEDWNDPALTRRIRRASRELWLLMKSRFTRELRSKNWEGYQHDYGSANSGDDIDLNTDLMKLATGGSAI